MSVFPTVLSMKDNRNPMDWTKWHQSICVRRANDYPVKVSKSSRPKTVPQITRSYRSTLPAASAFTSCKIFQPICPFYSLTHPDEKLATFAGCGGIMPRNSAAIEFKNSKGAGRNLGGVSSQLQSSRVGSSLSRRGTRPSILF